MISTPAKTSRTPGAANRLGPLDVFVLSAWCGLAAGELEVLTRALNRSLSSTNRLYQMSRHFVWLVPLITLSLFLVMGAFLAAATKLWPRRAGWLSPRLIGAWAVLPALLEVSRRIYNEAWLIVALGIASFLSPLVERDPRASRRWLALSAPVLLGMVLIQAGWIFGGDRLKSWREEGRPLPPAGSPNVLLVVLDTVRADHLSLYGYARATSPTLERLAKRGIRFDQARATAPWTLASHASMFTGRWPHELAMKWMFPLRGDVPTLAEFLGSLGYATAGFAGNTLYCSYDSGLNRGFTHYTDYVLDKLSAARTVRLIDLGLKTLSRLGPSTPNWRMTLLQLAYGDRKRASVVNREFLDWLSRRRQPRRPFFAFVNYMDAHAPYVLPAGTACRFGSAPETEADLLFLTEGWSQVDKRLLTRPARTLARDSYDNCLAYLDDQLGDLFGELQRRGVLDQTLVIVTADHGEGLGEHDLFDHGESLYRTEIRVPLLIVYPASGRPAGVVAGPVSLRDIPATIADLIDPATQSPFPGGPLAALFRGTPPAPARSRARAAVLSELASPNPSNPNQGRSPGYHGPLISLAEGDFVYIRNEGDGREELFDEHDDPLELTNRAGNRAMLPLLRRFRDSLDHLKADSP